MLRSIAHQLDHWAIQMACTSIPQEPNTPPQLAAAQALVAEHDYFDLRNVPAAKLSFSAGHRFTFPSAFASPWPENNIVHGRLFPAAPDWSKRPTAMLLHGWNGESGYDWQFPYLAWRLNRKRINALIFELPYHAQRKPRVPAPVRNFISHDFLRMAEAVRQSLWDATALSNWLRQQGVTSAGLWGVSLGAWLTGLLACHDPRWRCAVLLTPVVRMDHAFDHLPFCAPIRRGQEGLDLTLQRFNLGAHRPLLKREQLLFVESTFDQFAPMETVEELWSSWGRPEIWRYQHGHISILMSLPIMERIVGWIARSLEGEAGGSMIRET
jgi:pimeloyl-ACP methyl ester carboxylesterase